MNEPFDQQWHALSDEVLSGMRDWRTQHPKATFREIENAVDAHLARLRAQMLQDSAMHSPAADWAELPPAEQPTCPQCAQPLTRRGLHTRHLTSHHEQPVRLSRQYATCHHCGRGFFPPR